ncbi:MAG: KH domain-containing protein, partial [Pelagibacterales bacterium]|nr:KH domain-containing protein [Pelagibacterales bacterium]
GVDGSNLKHIGTESRKELKRMLDKEVHLFLFVKVKDNWDTSPDYYKNLGLDYNV